MACTFSSANINTAGNQLQIVVASANSPLTSALEAFAEGLTLYVDGVATTLGVWSFSALNIYVAITGTPVYNGQTVTLSYDGTGGIIDGISTPLAIFTNQAVTN